MARDSSHVRVTVRPPLSVTPTVFYKFYFNMTLERKKKTNPASEAFSRADVRKQWTWTSPFARPRRSSTSDEGGSAVPNSRLITAVIWISRTPMGNAGPLGSTSSTQTITTATPPLPLRYDKDKATEKPNARRVGNGTEGASRAMGILARNSFHNE